MSTTIGYYTFYEAAAESLGKRGFVAADRCWLMAMHALGAGSARCLVPRALQQRAGHGGHFQLEKKTGLVMSS